MLLEGELRPATIRWEEGEIVEIGTGSAEHDVGDLVVLSGLVDSHVHVNEPGRTHWEGFVTATRAAILGGTTTIVDMPLNSSPPTVSVEALAAKRRAAEGKLSCDVAFWAGIVPGSSDEVANLADSGVCGFKVFLCDSGIPEYPPLSHGELAAVDTELPLLIHAEDPRFLGELGSTTRYLDYLSSRPPIAEAAAIERLITRRGPTHILHVSSAEAVEASAKGPDTMSGETCPHYLLFSAEEIPERATEFKCSPPIRQRHHQEALWEGLVHGSLGMVVSDHSPSPPELKARETGDYASAWGGISGLQVRLQAVWTGMVSRRLGIEWLGEWLSGAPSRLAGLDDRKGSIEVGKDADLVVFDPDGLLEVKGAQLQHRHPLTPYEGMRLRGEVVEVWLDGTRVVAEGTIDPGHGRMLRR